MDQGICGGTYANYVMVRPPQTGSPGDMETVSIPADEEGIWGTVVEQLNGKEIE